MAPKSKGSLISRHRPVGTLISMATASPRASHQGVIVQFAELVENNIPVDIDQSPKTDDQAVLL